MKRTAPMMIHDFRKPFDHINERLTRFQAIFICVLLGMGLLLALLPNSYWANDNIGLMHIIRLGFTTSFMSAILGRFLSFFYLHVHEGFPWYAVLLYLVHALSITFFIYSASITVSEVKRLFRISLLYLVIYSILVIRLGYNGTSIMIGANSLLLFCLYLKKSPRVRTPVVLLLGFSFSLSYLLRTRSIYGVLIFVLPALALFFIYLKNRRYRYVPLFLAPAIVLIAFNNYYTANFTSERYKEYVEYNKVRGRFHDFPIVMDNMSNKKILEANGWSRNDYVAFSSWFFHDENIFSLDKINNIFEYSTDQVETGLSIKEIAANIGNFCIDNLFYLITLVFILLALTCRSSKKTILICVGYSLYSVGGMLYMNEFYRFPPRIGVSVFLLVYSYLALIFIAGKQDLSGDIHQGCIRVRPWYEKMINTFYVVILIIGILIIKWEAAGIHSRQGEIHEIVDAINKLPPDSVVMSQPVRGLEAVDLSPLRSPAIKKDIHFITGGWNIFSERYYHQIEKAGVAEGQDLFEYLIDSDRLYMIIGTNRYKRCVATYLKEHYQSRIRWVRFAEAAETTIYNISSRSKETQRKKIDRKFHKKRD